MSADNPESTVPEPGGDALVDGWLERGRDAEAPPLPGGFEALGRRLDADGGILGTVKGLATPIRMAALAVVVLLVVATVLGTKPRPDLSVMPLGRLLADLALLGAPLLLAVVLGFHPIHRAELPRGARIAGVSFAVFAAGVVCVLPPAHFAHPASMVGTGDDLVRRALACFAYGSALAVPVVVITRVLSRGATGVRGLFPTLLAVTIAVLAGSIGLYLHCPITANVHLIAGHATIWIPFLAIVIGWGRGGLDG